MPDFNDAGVVLINGRSVYSPLKKRCPEGQLVRYGKLLRIGTICPEDDELHRIEELISSSPSCGCVFDQEEEPNI